MFRSLSIFAVLPLTVACAPLVLDGRYAAPHDLRGTPHPSQYGQIPTPPPSRGEPASAEPVALQPLQVADRPVDRTPTVAERSAAAEADDVDVWMEKVETAAELNREDRESLREALEALDDDSLRGLMVAQYLMHRSTTKPTTERQITAPLELNETAAAAPAAFADDSRRRNEAEQRLREAERIRGIIAQELSRHGLGAAGMPQASTASLPTQSTPFLETAFAATPSGAFGGQPPPVSGPTPAGGLAPAAIADAAPRGATWQEALTHAIAKLDAELQRPELTSPERLQLESRRALLHSAAGRAHEAVRSLQSSDDAKHAFWTQEVIALADLIEASDDENPQALTSAVRDLRRAAQSLGESAPLDVRSLAFATKAHGFGAYDLYNDGVNEFAGGEWVLLYAEIENYQSTPTAAGTFRTSLEANYRIFDEDGRQIEEQDLDQPIEDYCRNYRKDFFIPFHVQIPSTLATGRYQLELRVTDLLAEKQGASTISFRVQK